MVDVAFVAVRQGDAFHVGTTGGAGGSAVLAYCRELAVAAHDRRSQVGDLGLVPGGFLEIVKDVKQAVGPIDLQGGCLATGGGVLADEVEHVVAVRVQIKDVHVAVELVPDEEQPSHPVDAGIGLAVAVHEPVQRLVRHEGHALGPERL